MADEIENLRETSRQMAAAAGRFERISKALEQIEAADVDQIRFDATVGGPEPAWEMEALIDSFLSGRAESVISDLRAELLAEAAELRAKWGSIAPNPAPEE